MCISAYQIPQIFFASFVLPSHLFLAAFFVVDSVFAYCHSSISCLFPRAAFSVQNNVCNLYLDLLILILALFWGTWFLFCYFHTGFFTALCFKTCHDLPFRNISSCLHFYGCMSSVEYSSFFHCRSVKKTVLLVSQSFGLVSQSFM